MNTNRLSKISIFFLVLSIPLLLIPKHVGASQSAISIAIDGMEWLVNDEKYMCAKRMFMDKYDNWSIQEGFFSGEPNYKEADIILFHSGYRGNESSSDLLKIIRSGKLADLSQLCCTQNFLDKLYAVQLGRFDNKQLLLPYVLASTFLHINKEDVVAFESATGKQIEFPQDQYDWKDLLEVGRKLFPNSKIEKEPPYAFLSDTSSYGPVILHQIHAIALKNGIDELNYFTNDIQEMMAIWKEMRTTGLALRFVSDKTTVLFMMKLPVLADISQLYFSIPSLPDGEQIVPTGAVFVGISAESSNIEKAKEFLADLLSLEAQSQYNQMGVVRRDISHTPVWDDLPAPAETWALYETATRHAVMSYGTNECWEKCAIAFEDYIWGKKTIEETCQLFQEIMSSYYSNFQ